MDKKEILECLEEIKSCVEQLYTRDGGIRIDESLLKFSGQIQIIHHHTLELIEMIKEG